MTSRLLRHPWLRSTGISRAQNNLASVSSNSAIKIWRPAAACQNVHCLPPYPSCHPVAHFGVNTINGVNTSNVNLGWSFSITTLYQSSCRFYNGRSRRFPLDDDVLQLPVDNLDNLPPDQYAAVWTFILRNTIWAFATAHDFSNTTWDDFSNTTWAFATVKTQYIQNPGLFKKIGDAVVNMSDLKLLKPQDFSNTVWAFATANIQHPDLFKKVGDAVVNMSDLAEFKPQELSITIWAFATAKEQHPGLFKKIGDAVVNMSDLKSFNPQALSITIWAFATANIQNPGLFRKVGDAVVNMSDLAEFKPQNLANTVWAFATANIQHPGLFKKIGDAVVKMSDLAEFKPQELSNTVWAFATANIQHPGLFKMIGDTIIQKNEMKSFNDQDLSNIAWSYAVANLDAPEVFNDAFTKALLHKQNGFSVENIRQLHQWHLWQTKEMTHQGLPEVLQERCYQAFINGDETKSSLQKGVVKELVSIGLNPVEEFLTESGYSLDALVEIDGKRVGIEVDGPFHFIGKTPNGKTLLKRRQVPKIDEIILASVPYWEWDKLGKDQTKKQNYLRTLLELKDG